MPVKSGDSKTATGNNKLRSMQMKKKNVNESKTNTTADDKPNKKSKKASPSWGYYLYKVLKEVHQDNIGISGKAMLIMNNLMEDLFERIAMQASQLAKRNKKKNLTIQQNDINAAVKLLIPGELCHHSISEGQKAVRQYYRSLGRKD